MKWIRKTVAPVIWIIVISFALWGIENIFVGLQKESKGVGKAFGKTISFKTFQDARRSVEIFSQKPAGEKLEIEELENSAWQNIVLGLEAQREKISVTDEEVKNEIERLFTADVATFNPEFYQNWVQKNFRESPRLFEERIRDNLRIRKLVERHQNPAAQTTEQKTDQQKQDAFLKWLQDVMQRAKIEKFDLKK